MKHCIALVLSCLVGCALTLPLRAQEGKLPVPPPLEQEETAKLVKQLFKSEYSKKTTVARRDLGKVLLSKAKREKADMVARYVLLSEAINLSARSADLNNSMEAFKLMENGYLIDSVKVKAGLLSAFPRTKSLITEETIFDEWMTLVDMALAMDDYSTAERFAGLARKRASRDKLLAGIAKDKAKYINLLEKRFEEVKPSLEKLAGDPANLEANGILGEFFSLYKRDWKTGILLLSKGPDGDLKKLADEEFKASGVTLELQGIADGWWEMAQSHKTLLRKSCLMRAAHWYRKVLVGLEGLSQVRIEKKLSEIEKEIGISRGVKLSELQVFCYQSRRWKPHQIEKMTLARRSEALIVKNTTGISSYALLASKRLVRGDFSATVHVYGGRTMGITADDRDDDGLRSKRLEIELKEGWQRIRVERVGESLTFSVNGKPVRWKANSIYTQYYPPPKPEQTGYLFISLTSGQQCSSQQLELETATKEFGLTAGGSGSNDDEGGEGRGRGDDDRGRSSRGRGSRD